MTQIEFVRTLPPELPVEEVVKKAEARGLKLRAARVKVIRRELKRKKTKLRLVTSPALAPHARKRGRPTQERIHENQQRKFIELVFTLGMNECNQLIAEARARVGL